MLLETAYKLFELDRNCSDSKIYKKYTEFLYLYNSEDSDSKRKINNDIKLNRVIDAMQLFKAERKLPESFAIYKIIKLSFREAVYGCNKKVIRAGVGTKLGIPPWSYYATVLDKGRYKYLLDIGKSSEFKVVSLPSLGTICKNVNISKTEFVFGATKIVATLGKDIELKIPPLSFKMLKNGVIIKGDVPKPGAYFFKVKVI
jgi:hypothetical protein